MPPDRQALLRRIFDEASGMEGSDREAYLAREAGTHPRVVEEVRELLGCLREDDPLDETHDFLGRQFLRRDVPPAFVGEYRIVERLGEGGMGVVYRAFREKGFRQEVALKVMTIVAPGPVATRRFKREIDALARMRHTNIATVLDAGTTDDGAPYFTMECITGGRSIVDYCDDERLGLPDRLRLFIEVCRGVQHAHQKNIIHRDIKPSNVLVTVQDGRAVPKLIDFGIARALDPRADDAVDEGTQEETAVPRSDDVPTVSVRSVMDGVVEGTLCYMSPEQTLGRQEEVDIRTDVYSLGVLLYELVVGSLPLPRELFDGQPDMASRLELVRTEPPRRPSERLEAMGERAEAVARARGTSRRRLVARCRDELDWIVMKAIAKSPDDRFDSVADLAAELERFLADRPVESRPGSRSYRLKKFWRRHRIGVAASSIVLLALVGGVVGITVAMVRARAAERKAIGVAEFLENAIMEATPETSHGKSVTVREMLDEQVRRVVSRNLAPETTVTVMRILGKAYRRLNLWGEAERLLEAARREAPPGDELVEIENELGNVWLRRGNHEAARSHYESALRLAEDLHGPRHESVAGILANLADVYQRSGDLAKARLACERSLAIRRSFRREEGGVPEVELAKSLATYGKVLVASGELEAAADTFRQVLEIRLRHVDEFGDLAVAYARYFLGKTLHDLGRFEDAREHLEEARRIWIRNYGPRSSDVGQVSADLARALHETGDDERADELFRDSVAIEEHLYSETNPVYVAERHEEYAAFLRSAGREGAAIEQERMAAAIREALAAAEKGVDP